MTNVDIIFLKPKLIMINLTINLSIIQMRSQDLAVSTFLLFFCCISISCTSYHCFVLVSRCFILQHVKMAPMVKTVQTTAAQIAETTLAITLMDLVVDVKLDLEGNFAQMVFG